MIVLTMFVGLFMFDNSEFFATVKDNIEDGHEVRYVGKQDVDPDVPSLPLGDKIFFKMEKSQ